MSITLSSALIPKLLVSLIVHNVFQVVMQVVVVLIIPITDWCNLVVYMFFQIFLSECLCSWVLCPTVGIGTHHLSAGVACSAVSVNVYCSLYDRARSVWLVNIWYVFLQFNAFC